MATQRTTTVEMSSKEIDELIEKLRTDKKRQSQKESYLEIAINTRDIYNSFVETGFSEEQAYELLLITMKGAIK